jgi:hypothetical protein
VKHIHCSVPLRRVDFVDTEELCPEARGVLVVQAP